MTIEAGNFKSIGCEPDPQQVAFGEAVKAWVNGEIDYQEMLGKYPTYLKTVPERIADKVMSAFRKPVSNGGKI